MAKTTSKFVTKVQRRRWQSYVGAQIRRQITSGVPQPEAVEHALDLRDEHIKAGDKPPRRGQKK